MVPFIVSNNPTRCAECGHWLPLPDETDKVEPLRTEKWQQDVPIVRMCEKCYSALWTKIQRYGTDIRDMGLDLDDLTGPNEG